MGRSITGPKPVISVPQEAVAANASLQRRLDAELDLSYPGKEKFTDAEAYCVGEGMTLCSYSQLLADPPVAGSGPYSKVWLWAIDSEGECTGSKRLLVKVKKATKLLTMCKNKNTKKKFYCCSEDA